MPHRIASLGAALVVILTLAIAVTTANATRLELPNSEGGFTAVWTTLEFKAGGFVVKCPVAVSGTFHRRTFAKTARILVGNITAAQLEAAACVGGVAAVFNESLPWNVQYASFTGTLPAIASVKLRVIGAMFSITPAGSVMCTVRTTEAAPGVFIANVTVEAGGERVISTLRADETVGIPLAGGGGLCGFAGNGNLFGTALVTRLIDVHSVRIRLI